ncbi:hypothetical protein HK102_010691, partial [Quaeritorhiza haematococci]
MRSPSRHVASLILGATAFYGAVAIAQEAPRPEPAAPRADYKVVAWFDLARPIASFQYQVYDVRKGDYTPAVEAWVAMMAAKFPNYDVAVRDVAAGPTVFVKNKLEVRGTLSARGFAGQTLDVELLVEDQPPAVARAQITVPAGTDAVPIAGLNYIPQTPGEKKVTLKVAPREGELVVSNNEISTFVTVLSGGLNVLFLQGPNFTWDYRYLMNSIATSPDIEVKGALIRAPAVGEKGELDDDEFTPGRYDVYVLSDMAANFLTRRQQQLLADSVKKGAAGLMMLGGRASFGPGGWGQTEVADGLPGEAHPGDGDIEP